MKKFIITLLLLLMASTITVRAAQTPYGVTIETAGDGEAKCFYNDDGTVTFYAEETSEPFVFWNVQGDYELIDDDYADLVFTIRPLSDLRVIASYESAMPHKVVSPQTGDRSWIAVILLIMASVVACIAFLRLRR